MNNSSDNFKNGSGAGREGVDALSDLVFQYKDRLRASDFERLRLERRLLSMERDQNEISADFVSSQRAQSDIFDGRMSDIFNHQKEVSSELIGASSSILDELRSFRSESLDGIEDSYSRSSVLIKNLIGHFDSISSDLTGRVSEFSDIHRQQLDDCFRQVISDLELAREYNASLLRNELSAFDSRISSVVTSSFAECIRSNEQTGRKVQQLLHEVGEDTVSKVAQQLDVIFLERLYSERENLSDYFRLHGEMLQGCKGSIEDTVQMSLLSHSEQVMKFFDSFNDNLSIGLKGSDDALRRFIGIFEEHSSLIEKELLEGIRERMSKQSDLLDDVVVGHGRQDKNIVMIQDLIERQQDVVLKLSDDLERMEEKELVQTRSQLDEMRKLIADANLQSSRQLDALRDELYSARVERDELYNQLAVINGSASFALGKTLVNSLKTLRDFVALPLRIYKISKVHLAGRALSKTSPEAESDSLIALPLSNDAGLSEAIDAHGIDVAIEFARKEDQRGERAKILTQVARNRFSVDPTLAVELGRLAYKVEPVAYRQRWLAFMEFDAGGLSVPAERLSNMPDRTKWKPAERRKAAHIEALARWLLKLPEVPEKKATLPAPGAVILYVAASSLPYHHTGYTIRTQSVCKALLGEGWELHAVTRPGYPADRPDAVGEVVEGWHVDGVAYSAIQGYGRALPADEALEDAATALTQVIEKIRPSVIHAASNYENALPALIAARRAGVPFVYEVRGLWELTASSKIPGWEQSERFQLEASLEALVAKEADSLMTLNKPIAEELFKRIGEEREVLLIPNAIDPLMLEEVKESVDLPEQVRDSLFLLGYAGSVVGYEGLDDLLVALSLLLPENPGIRVLIIGSGEALEGLKQLAVSLSIAEKVAFIGKTNAAQARAYLSRCDAVVIPRKPLQVCHVVSPLKPLEAMAMKIPVIASDVRAIAEIIDDGRTGLLFRAGDHVDLARVIRRLMNDPEIRERLPEAAYADVTNTRTWSKIASTISFGYSKVSHGRATPDRNSDAVEIAYAERIDLPGVKAAFVQLPAGRNAFDPEERTRFEIGLSDVFRQAGISGLQALIDMQSAGRSTKFAAFCAVRAAHVALEGGEAGGAVTLLNKALEKSDDRTTLKAAARMYFGMGRDAEAAKFFNILSERGELDESSSRLAAQVKGRRALLALPPAVSLPMPVKGPVVVVNFLHFSLPYTSVGYATRSHGIAMGVAAAGWDIKPYTRLGFPQDFKNELEDAEIPDSDVIDGVVYQRIRGAGRKGASETEYLSAAADACESVLIKEKATIVHAASNYTTALPALIAARRLGLPFVYEIRGFWEVTRSSRDATFERSSKFRTMKFYEDFMLANSDQIITITSAMREELIGRGVDSERISIAYNSVDVSRFHAQERDCALAAHLGIPPNVPVVGYIGSFVDYEGLDDLLSAAAMLRERGIDFRLLMVGDGAVMDSLREQVEQLQLSDHVILTGRVPHEEVEAHYSLIDVAPFPRKPWEVCELVSPLKPFEAMAMCKPVVVSSTRALLEIVQDGVNGLVFEKGRAEALADALQRLISNAELRSQLGLRARSWVEENRSWTRAGAEVGATYSRLIKLVDVLPEAGLAGDKFA